jgi:multidrug resistance efflux pump
VCQARSFTVGTQLAVAYDFDRIFVTARVDETDINQVHPGQLVDMTVDAFPDAQLTGHVRETQGGAAAVFSLFPQSNSAAPSTRSPRSSRSRSRSVMSTVSTSFPA